MKNLIIKLRDRKREQHLPFSTPKKLHTACIGINAKQGHFSIIMESQTMTEVFLCSTINPVTKNTQGITFWKQKCWLPHAFPLRSVQAHSSCLLSQDSSSKLTGLNAFVSSLLHLWFYRYSSCLLKLELQAIKRAKGKTQWNAALTGNEPIQTFTGIEGPCGGGC